MFSNRIAVNVLSKRLIFNRKFDVNRERINSTNNFLMQTVENSNIKSTQDWKNVRKLILESKGPVNSFNIDAMTIGACTANKKYDLALSYLHFLKEEHIELNLATLGRYFKLLYLKSYQERLSPEGEEEILNLYASVKEKYPILDSFTTEAMVQALSLTKNWRLCVDCLNDIKVTTTPGSSAYSAIISAAFRNGDYELAWNLFSELMGLDRIIQPVIFISYFEKMKEIGSEEGLEKMFTFLGKNSVKIEDNCLEAFMEPLKAMNVTVTQSVVTNNGTCKCCRQQLQIYDITESEFDELKTKIFQNVIVGKDIFNKTTPAELKLFKEFISKKDKFDVIVDGLNVAYSVGVKQSPLVTSGLVATVVEYFVEQKKKVLVLGRSHMNRWPKENWNYIQNNATLFLTQDLSQDDPYFLYCALNSGKDTILVTRDLMRGHKFLLKNIHLQATFDRWLFSRQYRFVNMRGDGVPVFKKPLPFSNIAQKNSGRWHIPYTIKDSIHNNFLCIRF